MAAMISTEPSREPVRTLICHARQFSEPVFTLFDSTAISPDDIVSHDEVKITAEWYLVSFLISTNSRRANISRDKAWMTSLRGGGSRMLMTLSTASISRSHWTFTRSAAVHRTGHNCALRRLPLFSSSIDRFLFRRASKVYRAKGDPHPDPDGRKHRAGARPVVTHDRLAALGVTYWRHSCTHNPDR
ncbi:hypothetical protein BC826DRAFT_702796 [Russula brevipes]|nr:hypothetical protein BC826DRAFT_702796 [Russula brevipes]